MTPTRLFLPLLLLSALAPRALAERENPLARFPHAADILLNQPATKGLVELPLTPELLSLACPDLADLRVAGDRDTLQPYILRLDQGRAPQRTPYEPARLFNAVSKPGVYNSVVVDFGSRAARTRIDVDTPGDNFRRRLTVEASQDAQTWSDLRRNAWLFHLPYEGGYTRNEVSLPDNDFRYLRLTVFHGQDDQSDIPITRVKAWCVKTDPPTAVAVPVVSSETSRNPKQNTTRVSLDLGFENLPLRDLTLACQDEAFFRRVEVFGRNRLKQTLVKPVEHGQPRREEVDEPWSPVSSGIIHRYPGAEDRELSADLTIPLSGRYRYLQVVIHNHNDQPLKLTGQTVTRHPYYLTFQPKSAGPYRLYFGDPEASTPQYDLVHFASRLLAEGLTPASLGKPFANPLFHAPVEVVPWTERYSWAIWAVLLVVLAALGLLVYRQARGARPPT